MKLNGNKPKRKESGVRQEKPVREKRPRVKPAPGRVALIAALAVVALVMVAAAAGVTYVRSVSTIFPKVRVDGIDLGGQSLDGAMNTLLAHGYESIGDETVTALLPLDVSLCVRADEVCSETPVAEIALMAYDACKGSSAAADALTYLRCCLTGLELESGAALTVDEAAVRAKVDAAAVEVRTALLGSSLKIGEDSIAVVKGASDVTVDAERLTAQIVTAFRERRYDTIQYEAEIAADSELDLEGLRESVFTQAADAYYSDAHEIVPEVVGVSFDVDEAQRCWDAAVYGDEVLIPLIFEYPEVTAEDLEALLFRDQLGTKTTSLWGSSANRINNVTRACESIDGIILMPGEEFSYNPALGKRTAENGYLPAGAYSGGEVVQEYGGGICQVSSTLYYCCLYANLKITARSCHYFPVNYLPAGLDATVSWGGPEYKFVNDRDYPIEIRARVEDNGVTVELWGTDTDGSYVEMKYSTWLVYDEEYTDVAVGYKARTWRSVYAADGTLLSSREESNSYYHYHDEDIEWPEEPEEPDESDPPEEPEELEDPEEPSEPDEPTEPEAPPGGGVMPPELADPGEEAGD